MRQRLREAADDRVIVRVTRSGDLDLVDGVVLGVGRRWVLLAATEETGHLEGHVAVRLKHVRDVERSTSFATRFATTQAGWPPVRPEGVDLDRTSALVRGLATLGELVAVEQEKWVPDVMWVGAVDEVRDGWLWLLEVRVDATWHDESLGYPLRRLSKVAVGSRYLTTLASVAPRHPADDHGPNRP